MFCSMPDRMNVMTQIALSIYSQVKSSQLYFRHKNLQLQNIQFSNTEINIEIKTATAVIKNELKYFSNDESSDDTYLK